MMGISIGLLSEFHILIKLAVKGVLGVSIKCLPS